MDDVQPLIWGFYFGNVDEKLHVISSSTTIQEKQWSGTENVEIGAFRGQAHNFEHNQHGVSALQRTSYQHHWARFWNLAKCYTVRFKKFNAFYHQSSAYLIWLPITRVLKFAMFTACQIVPTNFQIGRNFFHPSKLIAVLAILNHCRLQFWPYVLHKFCMCAKDALLSTSVTFVE